MRTQRPFADELPRLLDQRQLSIRGLARMVGVSDAHLSRVLRRASYKTISGDLARRIALALDLDEGYFIEARQRYIIDRIEREPRLRDRLYDELHRRKR
jgi:transcriptional regulator with XRE-family HTH domain